jgi:parallel beta-helix repeat protein
LPTVTFNAKPAEGTWTGTVYIRPDGSIYPQGAPIITDDYITYNLIGNITSDADGLVIQKSNIIVNGTGKMVEGIGTGYNKGIHLQCAINVTIANFYVRNFYWGIFLNSSLYNSVHSNTVVNNGDGIYIWRNSDYNIVVNNSISSSNYGGIGLYTSSSNIIAYNNVTPNNKIGVGIWTSSKYNRIFNNIISLNNEGMYLWNYSDNNIILNNEIVNNGYGISLSGSSNNSLFNNRVTANTAIGIRFFLSSNYNSVYENAITYNDAGISIASSLNNSIYSNTIANNRYGVMLSLGSNNKFYHNNFMNNTKDIYDYYWDKLSSSPSLNIWDDGYPSGGNYWSDYEEKYSNATEIDNSGIWNTAYIIDPNNKDNYPLICPVGSITRIFTVYSFQVIVLSNSSISRFEFDETNKQIRFTVTGSNETHGFCEVTFPKVLLSGTITVYKDGIALINGIDYTQTQNDTHYVFYITYDHSTHLLEIVGTEAIPEFPTFLLILPLIAIVSVFITLLDRKKRQLHA